MSISDWSSDVCSSDLQAAEPLIASSPEATARIVEGLITGMGFIGGGAILRLKDSVKGTATAASIWVTGAIGMAVGLGSLDVAVMLSVATVVDRKSVV